MIRNEINFGYAFFDGAPCIYYSFFKRKIMTFIFNKLINMIKNKNEDQILKSRFIESFSNGNPKLLTSMVKSMKKLSIILSKRTIKNECDCCIHLIFHN